MQIAQFGESVKSINLKTRSNDKKNMSQLKFGSSSAKITFSGSMQTELVAKSGQNIKNIFQKIFYNPIVSKINKLIKNIIIPPELQNKAEKFAKVKLPKSEPDTAYIRGLNDQEYLKIRRGVLGKVRTEAELSNKDVVKILNAQFMEYTPEDISQIVGEYPKNQQKTVLNLMNTMTQFGNMKSLEVMYKRLKKEDNIVITPYPSLNDTMKYFANSKTLFKDSKHFKATKNEGVFLVDKMVLRHINSEKHIKKLLLDADLFGDVKFVLPEGYNSGINVFEQAADLKVLTKNYMKKIQDLKNVNPNMTDDEAISETLNAPIQKRWKQLGFKQPLEILQNKTSENITPKRIASNLSSMRFNEQQFEKSMENFDKSYHPYIREYLVQNALTLSPRSISLRLKNLHKKIVAENGGTSEGLYYYIPDLKKSYGTIGMQAELSSGDNAPFNFVNRYNYPAKFKKMVILDDISASGDSLNCSAKEKGGGNKFIIAPIFATPQALSLLKDKKHGCGGRIVIDTVLKDFFNGKYFKSLNENDQKVFTKIRSFSGYDDTNTCISFPYMAPDNNNGLFANFFAKYFTLNGEGVKTNYFNKLIKNDFLKPLK